MKNELLLLLITLFQSTYCHGVAAGLYRMAQNEHKREMQNAELAEQKRLQDDQRQAKIDRQDELSRLCQPSHLATVTEEGMQDAEQSTRSSPPFDFAGATRPEGATSASSDENEADDENLSTADGDEVEADFRDEDALDVDDVTMDDLEIKPTLESLNRAVNSADPKATMKMEANESTPTWQSTAQLVRFRSHSEAVADNYLKSVNIKLRTGRRHSELNLEDGDLRRAYEIGQRDARKIDVRRRRIDAAPLL